MKRSLLTLSVLGLLSSFTLCAQVPKELTQLQKDWLSRAEKHVKNGWTYLHIEGTPAQRGFQHGYLLAEDISRGIAITRKDWEHMSGTEWKWLVDESSDLFNFKIDPEDMEEITGILDGMTAAGKTSSVDELIAYNAWIELSGYWWPLELQKIDAKNIPLSRESCSAFIATGVNTSDGSIVMGHNTMGEYQQDLPDVIIDIQPEKGHRILMQTSAGYIHSGTDFFITDAGLIGCETTIGDFSGFDVNGTPEFTRMRRATQDANNIDEWCNIMKKGNNGGYANAWLLGDVGTGEIARLELGLKFTSLERTKDGCYYGSNVAEDIRILRFETTTNESDIRDMSIARRVRWKQLMSENAGKIDIELAKQFEADHYDTYREKEVMGGRGLCCHAELETEYCAWPNAPYYPAGTYDAKVVDTKMARKMSFYARWGSACGTPFIADEFLEKHPQFDWMKGMLVDRPSEPWVVVKSGEKK
jgi:hypothetical protein